MMSRRNGTGMKFLLTVVIGGVFIFGLYTYHDQQTKLRKADENADKMQQQHDSLAAQLQVLFEHKSRLEKSLKTEESAHKKTRDDLTAEMSESEIRHANEKQDLLNRINTINKDYKMLQSQHEDMQSDLTKMQADYNKAKEDHEKEQEQHNAEYMQLRQEHQNSEAVLQNEVADLKQRNNDLLAQLDLALQNRDNNQHQLEVAEQEMIRLRRQLDRSQVRQQQQNQQLQQQQQYQQQQALLQQQKQQQEMQHQQDTNLRVQDQGFQDQGHALQGQNFLGQGHGGNQGQLDLQHQGQQDLQGQGQVNMNQQFWQQQQQHQQQQQQQQQMDNQNVVVHDGGVGGGAGQPHVGDNLGHQQQQQQQQQQPQQQHHDGMDRDLGDGQAQAYQQRQMEQHEVQDGQQMVIARPVDQQVGYHEVKPLDPAAQGQGQGVNAGQMQQPAAMDQVGAPRIDNGEDFHGDNDKMGHLDGQVMDGARRLPDGAPNGLSELGQERGHFNQMMGGGMQQPNPPAFQQKGPLGEDTGNHANQLEVPQLQDTHGQGHIDGDIAHIQGQMAAPALEKMHENQLPGVAPGRDQVGDEDDYDVAEQPKNDANDDMQDYQEDEDEENGDERMRQGML